MAENELPEPLVPADVDLRDFQYMPLDVVRLRDSSLAAKASGEEFRAAVLLWYVSWHQKPPASLPDDDEELASFCFKAHHHALIRIATGQEDALPPYDWRSISIRWHIDAPGDVISAGKRRFGLGQKATAVWSSKARPVRLIFRRAWQICCQRCRTNKKCTKQRGGSVHAGVNAPSSPNF